MSFGRIAGSALWIVPLLAVGQAQAQPRIVSHEITDKRPSLYLASYADQNPSRLVSPGRVTGNGGANWKSFDSTPDFDAGLPAGYRRNSKLPFYDPVAKRYMIVMNALDTPGLDPKAIEPKLALSQYYLRYRVSKDGGRTFIFDEPVIQSGAGFSAEHPIDGVTRGKNAVFLGDCGSAPFRTQSGHVLLPAVMTMTGPDGQLVNPFKQPSYTQVVVMIGTWRPDSRIDWQPSSLVRLGVRHSTRGVIEPTIAQFPDGRLLLVMRGSNGGKMSLPGYRWYSVSSDDGHTWSDAKAWTYDGGARFFSPSSMSVLVRHSSGRVFWIGNITPGNPQGNDPRWPLVFGEVSPKSLMLQRDSVIALDTKTAQDDVRGRELIPKFNGRLDLSHIWAFEDKSNGQIVVSFSRNYEGKNSDWSLVRVDVGAK